MQTRINDCGKSKSDSCRTCLACRLEANNAVDHSENKGRSVRRPVILIDYNTVNAYHRHFRFDADLPRWEWELDPAFSDLIHDYDTKCEAVFSTFRLLMETKNQAISEEDSNAMRDQADKLMPIVQTMAGSAANKAILKKAALMLVCAVLLAELAQPFPFWVSSLFDELIFRAVIIGLVEYHKSSLVTPIYVAAYLGVATSLLLYIIPPLLMPTVALNMSLCAGIVGLLSGITPVAINTFSMFKEKARVYQPVKEHAETFHRVVEEWAAGSPLPS